MCLCQDDTVGPVSWRGDCHCLPTHWPHSLQCTMTGRHMEVENHNYRGEVYASGTQTNQQHQDNKEKSSPWVGHEPTTLCSLGRALYRLSYNQGSHTAQSVLYTTDTDNNVTLTTWMIGAPSVIPSMMTSLLYLSTTSSIL